MSARGVRGGLARAARAALAVLFAAALPSASLLGAQRAPSDSARRGPLAPVRIVAQRVERVAAARERQRATEQFDPIFRKYTKRYFGIATDWRWFKAQGMAESDLIPTARSRVGARGIMQLMPSTYADIKSKQRELRAIDDPEWNIAAGIAHDRFLWRLWEPAIADEAERWDFMFGSYNAGQGTIRRAQRTALAMRLAHDRWGSIEQVAPSVTRWRYTETLGYVRKIKANKAALPVR